MTDEEMAEEYAKHNQGKYTNEFGNLYHAFLAGLEAGKDMAEADLATIAYMRGAERHKTKWHDLRKDPNDLPNGYRVVLNQVGMPTNYDPNRGFLGFGGAGIIAWCEIPTFTDKEKTMFEKEAKEYAEDFEKEYHTAYGALLDAFQDGAEFGYNKAFVEADKNLKAIVTDFNKANEWHYVKDELPRKSDAALCELMPVFVAVKVGYNVSTYGTYWNLRLGNFECLDEVYAWCYAPEPPELPKEIKEK